MNSAYSFFIGWLLIILILWGFAQSDWGERITYYTLWLMVTLLSITRGKEIAGLIAGSGIVGDTAGTPGEKTPPAPIQTPIIRGT